jgi:hypothetical protein
MRKRIIVLVTLGIAVGWTGGLARATTNMDLTDFNEDVMKDMDDAFKSLDSNIATKNAKAAVADAQVVRDGLKWAEDYFTRKGKVEDAVKLARQGQDLAAAVAKSAAASDFDTALTDYDSLVKTCRVCHDAYKPPDL